MNREQGFTLVELMITLAVATILLTVAIPSFNETIKNNRLITKANELVGSLHLARSEAVKHASDVYVCVSSNGTGCTGGTNWSQGWLVWADLDDDQVLDAGEERKVAMALPTGLELSSPFAQIEYSPQGAAANAAAFTLCDDRSGETGRLISISATGRANVATQACT